MRAYALQEALTKAVGDSKEESGYEWYDQYTGLNGFYHILAGTGDGHATNTVNLTKKDGSVEVPGLGTFTFVETTEENFDTYEKSWDNYLVFEFEGNYYRVEGYLDSHQGGVWDGPLYQVKPVEKTIRVWEEA